MVPHGRGLRVLKQAARLAPGPVNRAFLAAILRRAAEHVVPRSDIQAELKAQYNLGRKRAEAERQHAVESAQQHAEELQRRIDEFEAPAG